MQLIQQKYTEIQQKLKAAEDRRQYPQLTTHSAEFRQDYQEKLKNDIEGVKQLINNPKRESVTRYIPIVDAQQKI